MKQLRFIQAAVLLAVVVTITSCGSPRAYSYSPLSGAGSLIINSSPGLSVVRDPYGRYYYRDTRGYVYWRGYDNRYYLDRKYVSRSYYHHNQYNDWRHYHSYRGRRR